MVVDKYHPYPISANGTYVIARGKCVFGRLTINTKGASSNTITIYDSTTGSGTKVATIDSTSAIGSLFYDVQLLNGLTIVVATGTAADITVSYMI
jgi:hypothetical protein